MARSIAVIDAETDPFDGETFPSPFIWGYYDGAEFIYWYSTREMIEFLETKNIIVYAHNGGKFDYHFLLQYLVPYDEITIINGRIAKFKIGLCEFRDSYSILPIPLSSYEKDEIDYDIMREGNRNKPGNMQKIINYLQGDCIYLYDLVNGFRNEFGAKLTLAGSALTYWKKISSTPVPKSDKNYYDYFSKYYYGGRVECFKTGVINHPFKMIDINSAYPYAMLEKHPYSLSYDIVSGAEIENAPIIDQSFYAIECVTQGKIGPFPFRDADGSLIFPVDGEKRLYYVTGWELKAAFENNAICFGFYIHCRIDFDYSRDFKSYILPFYTRRLKAKEIGDKKEDIFCKLMMNSLYGKFGANPDNYAKYIPVPHDVIVDMESIKRGHDIDLDNYYFGGQLGPWALGVKDLEDDEQAYYNVATAASITGFVRAYLYRALIKCDTVLYCDTDSIAATEICIELGNDLGAWSNDGDFIKGAIGGKKLYAFISKNGDEKIAAKGARLSATEIFKIAEGETIIYKPLAPTYSIYKPPEFVERKIKMVEKRS